MQKYQYFDMAQKIMIFTPNMRFLRGKLNGCLEPAILLNLAGIKTSLNWIYLKKEPPQQN